MMVTFKVPRDVARPTGRAGNRGSWRTKVSEAIVSVFILAALIISLVWSIPDSPIRQAAIPVLAPVARATGLEQGWGMFSPDPPRLLTDVEVHVVMLDGQDRVWKFESNRSVLKSFGWDRWRKLKEQLIAEGGIRAGFAYWVVRELTEPGERVARIAMVMKARSLPPPGSNEPIRHEQKLIFDQHFPGGQQ